MKKEIDITEKLKSLNLKSYKCIKEAWKNRHKLK